jgi:hypothetical protein
VETVTFAICGRRPCLGKKGTTVTVLYESGPDMFHGCCREGTVETWGSPVAYTCWCLLCVCSLGGVGVWLGGVWPSCRYFVNRRWQMNKYEDIIVIDRGKTFPVK